MYQLNNLDIIILIVIAISALIALSRGLMKEVLSIVGWVLGVAAIIYLLPVLTPFAKMYIENGWLAGVVTSLFILILFLVCWTLFTGKLVGKVRSSKLSGLDRMLGLFFGIARAFLLIILFYILVSWMIPEDKQSETLRGSKYLQAKVGNAFKKVKVELQAGKLVLFTGTGCQVNGLKKFLGKDYDNLICMDVICHGAPSPALWKEYAQYQEKKSGGKLKGINFRCKDESWTDFGMN